MSEDLPVETTLEEEVQPENCRLCGILVEGPLVAGHYCAHCAENLEKAYTWLQKPFISAKEAKELHNKMLDLTDISKVKLE